MLILILIDLFYVIPQRRVPYRLRCYLMTKNLYGGISLSRDPRQSSRSVPVVFARRFIGKSQSAPEKTVRLPLSFWATVLARVHWDLSAC